MKVGLSAPSFIFYKRNLSFLLYFSIRLSRSDASEPFLTSFPQFSADQFINRDALSATDPQSSPSSFMEKRISLFALAALCRLADVSGKILSALICFMGEQLYVPYFTVTIFSPHCPGNSHIF